MTNDTIETQILSHLLHTEEYTRKILPYIKEEYFKSDSQKIVFRTIKANLDKYNKLPTISSLKIDVDELDKIPEPVYDATVDLINELDDPGKVDQAWLIDKTEKFCQEKALHNSIFEAISIIEGESKLDKGSIPGLLQDALGVSFDHRVGHDFVADYQDRFDFYRKKEKRVKTDITILNSITKGGPPNKTLNVILAGTGGGKSLAMCHMASANLLDGKNVLYITMEMAEEKIAERIDANLLDIELDQLEEIPKESYYAKMQNLKKKTLGKLIIKEFPTAAANAGHFRHLVNELWLKKNFKPDIIYIDYINICSSSRIKQNGNVNSYFYIKAIAEELRGLAVELDLPIWTATQVTRAGFDSSDIGLTDTSESFGLPATADFMIAIISNEELEKLGQIMIKQLKNRYGDLNKFKKFVVGIDRKKMRLYNVEAAAQDALLKEAEDDSEDIAVFDKTKASGNTEVGGFVWNKGSRKGSVL